MPVLNYKCGECGLECELLLHLAEQTVECPKCGSSGMERVVSQAGCTASQCRSCGGKCGK